MDVTKIRAQAARVEARLAREAAATRLWQGLASRYRSVHGLADGAPIPVADEVLLRAAVSASIEIERTTRQMIKGCVRPQSLRSLGYARSELRRALRSLNLIGGDGEGTNNDSAPPPGASEQERIEWSRRYVENRLAEGRQ